VRKLVLLNKGHRVRDPDLVEPAVAFTDVLDSDALLRELPHFEAGEIEIEGPEEPPRPNSVGQHFSPVDEVASGGAEWFVEVCGYCLEALYLFHSFHPP
jgi:hypothetical protein